MEKELKNQQQQTAKGRQDAGKKAMSKGEIHKGHRGRLVETALEAGVENLTDIQAMELFLTYILPRVDTNETSHRLLDKFNNFTNTIDGSLGDLMNVYGINERSAKKIVLFRQFVDLYCISRFKKKFKVKNYKELIDVCEDYLRFQNTENCILVAISGSRYVTQIRRMKSESSMEVGINLVEVANFLTSSKAAGLAIAHCHPYGVASPSDKDVEGFGEILKLCKMMGVDFIDSYIIGENGVFSQKNNKLERTYIDVDDLKEAIITLAKQD